MNSSLMSLIVFDLLNQGFELFVHDSLVARHIRIKGFVYRPADSLVLFFYDLRRSSGWLESQLFFGWCLVIFCTSTTFAVVDSFGFVSKNALQLFLACVETILALFRVKDWRTAEADIQPHLFKAALF